MKKYILIIFIIFLSSCFQDNKDSDLKNQQITDSWVLEEISKKDIVSNYYSDDFENKENIKKWLSNKENFKTTEKWDVLEFLDFCENLKKEVIEIKDLNDFLYENLWEDDYLIIFGSKNKLTDISDIKEKVLKHIDSEANKDKAWVYYKNMFNDFFSKSELTCDSYVN